MVCHKIQIAICLLLCSLSGICQINISGIVLDSARNRPLPFANVIVYRSDSAITGCQTNLNGQYSIQLSDAGEYKIQASCMHFTAKSQGVILLKDTVMNFKLSRPLFYEQPCRQKIVQNKISMDLPAEHFDYCEYNRIMSKTVKLNLDFLTDRKEKYYIRIWTEPAFDYYGGYVTDLSKTKGGWIVQRKFYSSNYFDYLDYLDSSDMQESDFSGCDYDFDYLRNMKFSIASIVDTSISNGLFSKSKQNIFSSFFQVEDYCSQMRAGERHPCTDGVTYHLEIKAGNRYKFLTFENPQCLDSNYRQVLLFLDLLKNVEDNLNTAPHTGSDAKIMKGLFPANAIRLTQWMHDTTMLFGHYPLNETVYYLDDFTGRTYQAKTTSHFYYWDDSRSDTVDYTLTEPMFFSNPQRIHMAVQSDTVIEFDLLKNKSAKDIEATIHYDRIIRNSGLLDSVLVADGSVYKDLDLKCTINPVRQNVHYNEINFTCVTYHIFDGNTIGPRFIVLKDKAYFLTGLCSFPDFTVFTINNHVLIRTGTGGCDSGLLIDQIFEVTKDGVFEIFTDISRSM